MFSGRTFDPNDLRGISLVASVSDTERRFVQDFEEDRPEFRDFRAMMNQNSGVRL